MQAQGALPLGFFYWHSDELKRRGRRDRGVKSLRGICILILSLRPSAYSAIQNKNPRG